MPGGWALSLRPRASGQEPAPRAAWQGGRPGAVGTGSAWRPGAVELRSPHPAPGGHGQDTEPECGQQVPPPEGRPGPPATPVREGLSLGLLASPRSRGVWGGRPWVLQQPRGGPGRSSTPPRRAHLQVLAPGRPAARALRLRRLGPVCAPRSASGQPASTWLVQMGPEIENLRYLQYKELAPARCCSQRPGLREAEISKRCKITFKKRFASHFLIFKKYCLFLKPTCLNRICSQ